MTNPADGELTHRLAGISAGDPLARQALFGQLYAELREIAGKIMKGQPPSHSLQATALVHEAYLRLRKRREIAFEDPTGFICLAARAMRCVLIDYARRKVNARRVPLDDEAYLHSVVLSMEGHNIDLLELDEALERLAAFDSEGAQIVELRFFAGLSVEETARVRGIPKRSLERQWATLRNWLYLELRGER